jgi:uncharacterized protein YbjT (DUF2867 family)
MRILVTGATGYVGGRLVPELLAAGHEVVCLARTPAKLRDRQWRDRVEVVAGDVTDTESLAGPLEGIDVAYYLVHSMDGSGGFEERDRLAAATFRDACAKAGVGRIVYLGGLGSDDEDLSHHLESRHEVGQVLADGPVDVTELRAAVVIGSGSASFEMLRHLTEVLPVMVTPRWVSTRCQPIAVRDVLAALVHVAGDERSRGKILEIGGPEVLTYEQMMQAYAEEAGLRKRRIVRVPVLSPRLSSLWVGLVTPLPVGLARPLIDSLVNEVVVHDDPGDLVPPAMLTFREAVRLALQRVQDLEVATRWSTAGRMRRDEQAEPRQGDPDWSGGTLLSDVRIVDSGFPPDYLFERIEGIGGDRGYPSADALWELRGLLDQVVGGTGLRRGRRHPDLLEVGDALDFWRVEAVERPTLLRLRAEMTLPGEAWLQFEVTPRGDGGSRLVQSALFHPRGLWGRVYWYGIAPFHVLVFPRMAARLAGVRSGSVVRSRGNRPT